MTTTGITTFNLDMNDLVEEAYERCGLELRSGYDFRTARRSLNLLTIEWANRGINLWTLEQGQILMNTGQAIYPIPVDTIDLLDTVVRTNNGQANNQIDINISRISESTYITIPNKNANGRPIQVWVNRQSGGVASVAQTTLANSISPTDTTITLVNAANLPTQGFINIGSETIGYQNIVGNQIVNAWRGQNGTTATSHSLFVINYTAVANGILQAAVATQPGLALFGTTQVDGRSLGDINNSGTITSADSLDYTKWAQGVNFDVNQVAWIENTLNPYILANPVTYAAYLTPNSSVGVFNNQLPCINVWPTPNPPGTQYTFVYYRMRRIQDAGSGVRTEDIPFRFIPCMAAGLAYYLSSKMPEVDMNRIVMLKADYDTQWDFASSEDREKAPVRFVPRNMFYYR
jgi:hypothetical protein